MDALLLVFVCAWLVWIVAWAQGVGRKDRRRR